MNMNKILVGPSLLAADFSKLEAEIKRAEEAGVDFLHCDIMDGHFVPNITIGPAVIKSIRACTKLPLDVHLMIENPDKFIDAFIKAGSDMLTIHAETTDNPQDIIEKIKNQGIRAGISINPETPVEKLDNVLDVVDLVLVMSVHPGFGGQEFIEESADKIKYIRERFKKDIAVDGGINDKTAKVAREAGANMLAAGTYLFKATNMKKAVEALR